MTLRMRVGALTALLSYNPRAGAGKTCDTGASPRSGVFVRSDVLILSGVLALSGVLDRNDVLPLFEFGDGARLDLADCLYSSIALGTSGPFRHRGLLPIRNSSGFWRILAG